MADYAVNNKQTPLEFVTYETLLQKHPDHERWLHKWIDYRLLYKGGEELLTAAGQGASRRSTSTITFSPQSTLSKRTRRFLFQLEGEPDAKYEARWERAYYVGYIGAIIDYFRHWLFSQPPIVRPSSPEVEMPDWWSDFYNDCNAGGAGFVDFVRDVFLDVLLVRRAGWLIGQPAIDIGAVSPEQAKAVLTPYSAEEIFDWQYDCSGKLEWVLLQKRDNRREFPSPREQIETFTYVDRAMWRSWQCIESTDEKKAQIIGEGFHGLGEVPFVLIEIPHGLWAANKLASWQVDIFNKMNMLSYGELVSCFMQPYLKTNDESAQSRVFGEGTLLN